MYYSNTLLDVVVVTIGTDAEVTTDLLKSVGTRAWAVTSFHFDTYLGNSRRPSIGPRIKAASGCLAFVDFDRSPEEAVETTRYLTQAFPGKVIVVAMGRKPTAPAILNAMRAGCSEFLSKTLQQSALDVVFDRLEGSRVAELERAAQPGSVFAVLGAKGGVGATTIATHLAVYLAGCHGKRTLLIDQHSDLGHACVYLGIDGNNYTFSEVVRNLRRMDSELLQGFVARHSSGLEVMSSPDSSIDPIRMDPQDVSRTLEFLRGEYEYIVVDCDRGQPELITPVMEAANQMYLVGTPEIGAIRDLSRLVDRLLVVEQSAEKLQVVINRFNSPHAIPIEQIEKAMKLSVSVRIPNNFPVAVRATNTGHPLPADGKSDIAAALLRWSDSIVGAPARTPNKRKQSGLLSKWREIVPAW